LRRSHPNCAFLRPWLVALALLAAGTVLAACSVEPVAAPRSPSASDVSQTPMACNGSPLLCDRRLDQVVFATTHNAMSNAEEGWLAPNQHFSLVRQLDDGVRGFMLDLHPYNGEDPALQGQLALCHGPCSLGSELIGSGLRKFRAFLAARPHEVLVLILQDHDVPEMAIASALQAAGLLAQCHAQPLGQPWPTLRELIASGRRIVVLSEAETGKAPWNHAYGKYLFDTPYAAKTAADFSCEVLRGQPGNSLFLVNHFLTNPLANARYAEQVNHNPLLQERVATCQKVRQRQVNFIAVDFYDIGDLLPLVAALNAVGP